jgi:hypothetical protein
MLLSPHPRGRPRLPDEDRLSVTLQVRLDQKQFDFVKAMGGSPFVRGLLLAELQKAKRRQKNGN